MEKLTGLTLKGFKSILCLEELSFKPLNVMIGPNGAGKSNLISFFRMLNWMTSSLGNLQTFIGKYGGGSDFLFHGPSKTQQIEAHLTFKTRSGINEYSLRLFHAAPDTLIFADEKYRFSRNTFDTVADWTSLGSGHRESGLIEGANGRGSNTTAKFILGMLKKCAVYQFHNTSDSARIRQRWDLTDNFFLKEDGANLAPFLLRLKRYEFAYYQRIVETIRQINRIFDDFELEPEEGKVLLRWREKDSDIVFAPHQASDGSLRIMALVTLLLQPEKDLPTVLFLDEPELGLHPFAINIIAGLIGSVATTTQVIVATQSLNFLNYFEPEDIIVVDRRDGGSQFHRLDSKELKRWLDDYSLAELWEKNVIGGRP